MDTAPSLAAGDKTSTKSPSKEHILNERYLLQEELGRGAQGVVFRATDRVTGQAVAIKRMSLADMTPETLESYEHEITLLQNLKHKHIVQYQGHFKSRHHLHVVLEYMEKGSIAQVVKQILPDETIAAVYTSQVLEGLAYLHSQGVVHRDIKGANILTNAEGAVKLGDFGVAVRQPAGDLNGGSSAGDTLQSLADGADADVAGSPYWMAPEVIMMKSASAASDIWSVGCLVVEMITGAPPYYELQQMSALFRIVQDDYPPLPDGISPELEQFLLQCFEKDPHLRPTAKQLLRADWIRVGRRRVRDREWRKSWRNTVVRRPPPEEPDATPEPSTPPETLVAVAKPSGAEGEEGKRSAKRGWRARREARERERSSLVADEAGADVPTAKGPSVVAVHESVAAVLQRAVESENWDAAPDIEGGDSRRDGPGGLLPDGGKTSRMSFDHAGDTRYRGTRNFLPPFMRQPSVAGSSQHLLAGTTSIPENMQDEAPDRPLLGVGNERVEPSGSSLVVPATGAMRVDGEKQKVKKVQMSVEPPPSVSRTQSNARDHDNRFLSMPLETWISHANAQANGPPLPLSFGPSSAATAGSASNVHSPLSGFASGFPLSAFGSGAFDAAMAGGRSVTAQDAGNPPPSTRGTSGTPTPLSRMFHGRGAATLLNSKSAPKNVLHAPSPKAGQGEGNVHGGGGEVHAAGARAARGRVRRALANVQEAVRQDRAGGRMRRRASTAAKAVQKPQVAAAELLQALLEEDVDARQAVLDPEGLVVLLDLLDSAGVALSDELADVTMDIVNTLVSNDADVMSLMLLHGAAPQVLALASPGHRSLAVLSRVAVFLYAMCTLSPGSLRQLLCAGGVPVLVRMLGHGAVEDPAYAQRLLGCVWEVLERSEPIMLNSMCRIMARAGLVPRLFELVTGTTEALHDLNAARARGAGKAGGASEQFAPKVVATADGGRGLLGARGAVGGLASALASLGLTLTTALNPLSSRASGITSTPGGLGGGQKSTLSLSQSLGRSDVANGRANGDGARPKATDAERREALEATRAGAALVLTVCSHADSEVRHEFCSSAVLEPLLSCLGMMPMSIQAAMVRCYKHVSTEPSLLEDLQQGGLLEQLVNRLQATSEVSFSGPRVFENPSSDQAAALELRFEAISALHSLCKFDRHRQEIAATAGLIPSLCTFASSRIGAINPSYAAQLQHELRDGRVPESLERERAIGELAMALLCAMVYGTARTRLHLGAPALEVLLQAIHEDRWQLHVLDGLAAWLHDELHRVEPKLLEPPVIQCIVDMLDGVRREHAEARDGGGAVPAHAAASQRLGRILEPLIKILRASKRVAAALGRDGRVTWNVSALLGEERDALLRRSLLKVIRHLYEHHPQPKEFLLDPHLQDALHRLTNAEHENAVMVRAEAQKLLDAFRLNTVM
ncbi:unnamed protein product [Pedinophyceae sp. YPF-701]|nr:unnamed protein product [Pedinophyceae sp. YPF-701]